MIGSVSSYIRRFWLWMLEASLLYRAFSVVLFACVIAFAFRTEPAFRYCGLALQLMGLGIVVKGIWDTRRLFGQPTLRERFRRWLGRRPKLRQSPTFGVGLGEMGTAISSAEAELWTAMPDDAPVDQQLRALRTNVLAIRDHMNKQKEIFAADIREGAQKLQGEAAARTQRDTELETLIRSAQTGGLDVSFVGLVWLTFGLVLTTSSIEAERLAKWLFGG